MKQVHVFISGEVQGVGYRQFVRSLAKKNGVTGWVRNLPDGRVEAVMQSQENTLDDLLGQLRIGPFLAEVKAVEVSWEEGEKLERFEVR